MAKRKKSSRKIKLSSKQRRQMQSLIPFLVTGLAGLLIGIMGTKLVIANNKPANLVWAADRSVSLPKDLHKFLEAQHDCHEYRGTGTPTGVGLWGVYQTSQDKFAKIAYGCSWNLNSYIMAVKHDGKWLLLPPSEYFAPVGSGADPVVGALPLCKVVERYKIDKNIEPFCIADDGSAKSNDL